MPVIGRLDEQTHAVLIEPLNRRPKAEDDETEDDVADQTQTTPPGPSLAELQKEQDESNADLPLPVWLL